LRKIFEGIRRKVFRQATNCTASCADKDSTISEPSFIASSDTCTSTPKTPWSSTNGEGTDASAKKPWATASKPPISNNSSSVADDCTCETPGSREKDALKRSPTSGGFKTKKKKKKKKAMFLMRILFYFSFI